MFLKKILIILFLLIYSQNAFAITSGSYIGLDFISSDLSFGPEYTKFDDTIIKSKHSNSSTQKSFGMRYEFALNINGFYLAPTLFYENNRIRNNLNQTSLYPKYFWKFNDVNIYSEIKKRYGAKINLGYDFNDDFSLYFTIGKAYNYITNYTSGHESFADIYNKFSESPLSQTKTRKLKPLYGAGLKIKINNNWYLDGEFTYSRFKTANKNIKNYPIDYIYDEVLYTSDPNLKEISHDVILKVIKIGLSYNF